LIGETDSNWHLFFSHIFFVSSPFLTVGCTAEDRGEGFMRKAESVPCGALWVPLKVEVGPIAFRVIA
jgi:hypothetical protein